jgi:hypothetical protein
MDTTNQTSLVIRCVLIWALCLAIVTSARAVRKDTMPIEGEIFTIEGHTAFLILPERMKSDKPTPWVWYAPTIGELPDKAEKWMFEQFVAHGIAIAGVDVGESHGNPEGRAVYSALHKELVEKRGLAKKASLLARSRGGLMLYNWAAENPESVACIAGIYPVGNLSSYPGLGRAAKAYGMTEDALVAELPRHNPIDRLAPLAKARIPIFHIHGDQDEVVPLEKNSAVIKERYDKLGDRLCQGRAGGATCQFAMRVSRRPLGYRCGQTTGELADQVRPAW